MRAARLPRFVRPHLAVASFGNNRCVIIPPDPSSLKWPSRQEGTESGLGMRTSWLAAAPLALILLNLSPLPAEASHTPVTSLNCTATLALTISPGLSTTPSKGDFTTGSSPGPLECTGVMRGHDVTGPGLLGLTGKYGESSDSGDTCLLQAGQGTYSLTLPTSGGAVSEEGSFAEILGPAREGSLSAMSRETSWSGTFEFEPKQGDCLFTPITAALVTLRLEGRQGSDQPATVGLEGPGGAVVDPGSTGGGLSVREVADRQFLHGMGPVLLVEPRAITSVDSGSDVRPEIGEHTLDE